VTRLYDGFLKSLGGPKEADGVVTFGGEANYLIHWRLSYLQAASILLKSEHVPRVVMPVAYLQRHALELALKDLIHLARAVKEQEDALSQPRSPQHGPHKPVKGHVLRELMNLLTQALSNVQVELPSAVADLVTLFEKSEILETREGDTETFPERWRYALMSKGGHEAFSSVDPGRAEELPIRQRQEQMEAFFEAHLTTQGGLLDVLFSRFYFASRKREEALSPAGSVPEG